MAFQYRPRLNSSDFLVTVYKPKPASCSQSIGKAIGAAYIQWWIMD